VIQFVWSTTFLPSVGVTSATPFRRTPSIPYVSACIEDIQSVNTDDTTLDAFRWAVGLVGKNLVRIILEGSTAVMKAINNNSTRTINLALDSALVFSERSGCFWCKSDPEYITIRVGLREWQSERCSRHDQRLVGYQVRSRQLLLRYERAVPSTS
jgi:hypothetical protein